MNVSRDYKKSPSHFCAQMRQDPGLLSHLDKFAEYPEQVFLLIPCFRTQGLFDTSGHKMWLQMNANVALLKIKKKKLFPFISVQYGN